jgi:hypothetical protein
LQFYRIAPKKKIIVLNRRWAHVSDLLGKHLATINNVDDVAVSADGTFYAGFSKKEDGYGPIELLSATRADRSLDRTVAQNAKMIGWSSCGRFYYRVKQDGMFEEQYGFDTIYCCDPAKKVDELVCKIRKEWLTKICGNTLVSWQRELAWRDRYADQLPPDITITSLTDRKQSRVLAARYDSDKHKGKYGGLDDDDLIEDVLLEGDLLALISRSQRHQPHANIYAVYLSKIKEDRISTFDSDTIQGWFNYAEGSTLTLRAEGKKPVLFFTGLECKKEKDGEVQLLPSLFSLDCDPVHDDVRLIRSFDKPAQSLWWCNGVHVLHVGDEVVLVSPYGREQCKVPFNPDKVSKIQKICGLAENKK